LTDPALDDLNDARLWLHQAGAGEKAHKRYRRLTRAIRGLGTHPVRYRRDPDNPAQRIANIGRYRIMYEVTPDTGDNKTAGDVTVLAVLGPGEP
jgi:plasmid stabilization system protein ParE